LVEKERERERCDTVRGWNWRSGTVLDRGGIVGHDVSSV